MPTVAVVCGSRSDLPTLQGCFDVLDEYGISWEASVISAHRQPDALHAYVQMPPGVPVATVAIGSPGAKNAAHLAARILAISDPAVADRVTAVRAGQAAGAELRVDPRSG